jgi:hypothetical protein
MLWRPSTIACLLGICGFVFLPSHGQSQSNGPKWFRISNTDSDITFLDLDSRRTRLGLHSGWTLRHEANGQRGRVGTNAYTLVLYVGDCENETLGVKSFSDYTRSGEVSLTGTEPYAEMLSVAPGTVAQSILSAICGTHPQLVPPTVSQIRQRVNEKRLQFENGNATLPNGSWAVDANGTFFKVVDNKWVEMVPKELPLAAVNPPVETFRILSSGRLATLSVDGYWKYDDAPQLRVSPDELRKPGFAISVDSSGLRVPYQAINGDYFRAKYSPNFSFQTGDEESFGEFEGRFDGANFVPSPTYLGTAAAIEYAQSEMPYVNRMPSPRPKGRAKRR